MNISVVDVEKGGPAERAGLKRGDVIAALAGQPLRGHEHYLFWAMVYATNGQTIDFALADGRTLSITAESK